MLNESKTKDKATNEQIKQVKETTALVVNNRWKTKDTYKSPSNGGKENLYPVNNSLKKNDMSDLRRGNESSGG